MQSNNHSKSLLYLPKIFLKKRACMKKKEIIIYFTILMFLFNGCIKQNGTSIQRDNTVQYNLIKPANGIYEIVKKNVDKAETKNKPYEKKYLKNNKLIKLERYNSNNKLTDNFSVPAITKFEYDSDNRIKFVKYYNKENKKAADENFGYWSIEYVYDNKDRVIMELYRNTESEFLKVPRNLNGEIIKKDFLAPILAYEYLGDTLRIKAFDKNFNLLKEVVGNKPCVPFIDCGENE